jgi:HlyD family secretion protein
MTDVAAETRHGRIRLIGTLLATVAVTGCARPEANGIHGYVEAEYVYVGAPSAGALTTLSVRRGDEATVGSPLFALEIISETAARDEAERKLAQARANLEDLKKGRRPTEIASLEAQLKQAQAASIRSEREYARLQLVGPSASTTIEDLERSRATRDQDRQKVTQLEADLQTARLGAREDQVRAAEANVRSLESALVRAEWDLSQRRQAAPQAGLVFDTLFREGEWVPAGRPVVALLPPANIFVRSFVPEPRIGSIRVGERAKVTVDGVTDPFVGSVRFISPKAEFTPPVIFSRESRDKLVFMVEIAFAPEVAALMHPGQPVDVTFGD